jgi:hypothetical protein
MEEAGIAPGYDGRRENVAWAGGRRSARKRGAHGLTHGIGTTSRFHSPHPGSSSVRSMSIHRHGEPGRESRHDPVSKPRTWPLALRRFETDGPGLLSQRAGAVFMSYASLPGWGSGATEGATRNQARRKSKQAMGFEPTTSNLGGEPSYDCRINRSPA